MSRSITEEQVAELEQHHGQGMVVVLSVGAMDFAFRRLTENDVDLVLHGLENKLYSAHEEAAMRCILSVNAPSANLAVDLSKGGDKTKIAICTPEIIAERELLASLWAQAPIVRDTIGQELAKACGWHWYLSADPIGGGRYRVSANSEEEMTADDDSVSLTCSVLAPRQYEEQRKRMVTQPEGSYQRYNFRTCIEGGDEVARLYPYLPIAIGGMIPGLGGEGKAVRRKKFKSGSLTQLGNTGDSQAKETSP